MFLTKTFDTSWDIAHTQSNSIHLVWKSFMNSAQCNPKVYLHHVLACEFMFSHYQFSL